MSATLNAFIHTLRYEAKDTISVELRPQEGTQFPAFTPGSHIDLHLPNGLVRSYSLSNSSEESNRYVVGVLRDRASRGGSRSVHEDLKVGKPIVISEPRNHFALDESAEHTVLVAGGIALAWAFAQRIDRADPGSFVFASPAADWVHVQPSAMPSIAARYCGRAVSPMPGAPIWRAACSAAAIRSGVEGWVERMSGREPPFWPISAARISLERASELRKREAPNGS